MEDELFKLKVERDVREILLRIRKKPQEFDNIIIKSCKLSESDKCCEKTLQQVEQKKIVQETAGEKSSYFSVVDYLYDVDLDIKMAFLILYVKGFPDDCDNDISINIAVNTFATDIGLAPEYIFLQIVSASFLVK